MTTVAYIGLGSNLQEPRLQVTRALAALDQGSALRCVRRSSLYESAPVGKTDQPAFINAVAEVATTHSPEHLLQQLRLIESAQGRIRHVGEPRNGPRTLDLDLLLFGDEIIESVDLQVPHPRMHERAFVLLPLLEIAPSVQIPGLGAAQDHLAAVAKQGIYRILA